MLCDFIIFLFYLLMVKNDAYLGWMTTEGSGRRKSEKVPESGAVFGDIACDVEVLGISVRWHTPAFYTPLNVFDMVPGCPW